MSNISTNQIYRFPDDNNNTITPNDHGIIWSDTDNNGLDITNGSSFTAENGIIRVSALGRSGVTDDLGYDFTDTEIIVNAAGTVGDNSDNTDLNGDNRFVRCNFYRNETGNTRVIFGNFRSNGNGTNTLTVDECKFMAAQAPFSILNSQVDVFNFTNNRLFGAVGMESVPNFRSVGTAWASLGSSGGSSQTQFFLRAVHFRIGHQINPNGNPMLIPSGQANTGGDRLPGSDAVFLAGDDFSAPIANNTYLQFNANGAFIAVNCLQDGQELWMAGNNTSGTQPGAIYQMIGWKPEWRDATDNSIVSDIRIRYDRRSYEPRAFMASSDDTLDDINLRNRVANTWFDLDADFAGYRGVWLQTDFESINAGGNNNAARAFRLPAPVNANYRAKSYTHLLNEATPANALPTVNVTNAEGNADSHFGSPVRGIDDFVEDVRQIPAEGVRLNGFTDAATARAAEADTATDIYPILKGFWFDDGVIANLTDRLEWNGTTLMIKTAIDFQTSSAWGVSDFDLDSATSMDGDGITVDFRDGTTDQNVTWTTPTTITNWNISGGNHSLFPTAVTNTNFSNTPTINFTSDIDITAWTGTGRFTPAAASAITITCSREQAMEYFDLDIALGGTNTSITNITVAVPAAPAALYDINVVIPTGANGYLTLRNLDDNTNQDFTITNGTLSGTLPQISSTNTVNYGIYYKLDSTVGGIVYRTRVVNVSGNPGATITVEPLTVNAFFIQNAALDPNGADGTNPVGLLGAVNGSNSARYDLTWSNTSSSQPASGNGTQATLIPVANNQSYFNWIVSNEFNADPIDYRPAAVVWNNSADGVTGIGANDGVYNISVNNTTGNFISNSGSGLKTDNTTVSGVGQVQSIDENLASLNTVNNGIRGLFEANQGVTQAHFDENINDLKENQQSNASFRPRVPNQPS